MSLSIHLNFNGQCQQAFEFYVTVLQGEIDSMLQVKDAPISESFSADWQQKIVHASISIQDVVICGADVKPEYYQKPSGFYLLLGFGNEAAVISAFQQLSAGRHRDFTPPTNLLVQLLRHCDRPLWCAVETKL